MRGRRTPSFFVVSNYFFLSAIETGVTRLANAKSLAALHRASAGGGNRKEAHRAAGEAASSAFYSHPCHYWFADRDFFSLGFISLGLTLKVASINKVVSLHPIARPSPSYLLRPHANIL